MALGGVGMAMVNVVGAQALAGSLAAGLVDQGHYHWLVAHAASDAVHFSSVGGSVRQALHSVVFIICPMNGVDWHFFIVLNGGDGAGCVPASRLLSLGGGGDHCLLRLSASVKPQWLALGR